MVRPWILFVTSLTVGCSSSAGLPIIPPAEDAAIPEVIAMDASVAHADASDAAPSPTPVVDSTVSCALSGVHAIDVPAVHGSANSTRLRHRYRVFPATRANAPTVVVVPGGPGGDIMRASTTDSFALGAVPNADFNIIYTDARGSGCNSYPKIAEPLGTVYRTEEVSRDLIAVIRQEKLTDYILYGASFGTAAATVAAALLERESGPAPKRVVLEGTIGRAFATFDDYFAGFEAEWPRVKTLIHPAWRAELEKEPWPASLQWSRQQWASFVSQQLIIGDIPGYGHSLHYWLSGLSTKDPNAQSYVTGYMAAAATAAAPGDLFETIACRELWGSWKTGREIRNGKLVATGPDLCAGAAKSEPYDSASFKLTTPITYFQGPFDPTTTPAQADYHFANQTSAARQLVTVPAAAHAPLTVGLHARGCSAAVWDALQAAPQSLPTVLAACTKWGAPPVTVQLAH